MGERKNPRLARREIYVADGFPPPSVLLGLGLTMG